MKISKLLFPLFFMLLLSCTRKNIYTQQELLQMTTRADPEAREVQIPNHEPHRRVLCRDYGPGCLEGTGRRILIRKVELIAIAFENEDYARQEAYRLNLYYARNWLFDNTFNEPVLIDFITNVYGAQPGRAP